MKNLHSKEEMEQALAQDGLSVVIWSTKWCPDCLYLNPLLPALEAANPDFTFYHMDRDENLDLGIDLEILGIPSLIAYENGKEISRFVSTLRKTPEQIQAFLNESKEKRNGQF